MYRIRFAPYLCNYYMANPELQCSRVYSNKLEEIHMFLKQHNFDENQTFIENIPTDVAEEDDLEEHTLELYLMQSNEDGSLHQIYSTRRFIDLAVNYTAQRLNDTLILGECIFRQDIEVIKLITESLESIPCTEIADFNAANDQSVDDCEWMIVSKNGMDLLRDEEANGPSNDVTDFTKIWESISRNIMPDAPLPITIEAYVESFVQIIMKNYCGDLDDGDFEWAN